MECLDTFELINGKSTKLVERIILNLRYRQLVLAFLFLNGILHKSQFGLKVEERIKIS